ncbi:MAG: hypothetical protein DHS80DRAFT_28192 [Piptocephalis tieghemiana]|nr:MAG: hypothetical protein DHS80DRAFT_28192 [Piptocephalis tieghemiana]
MNSIKTTERINERELQYGLAGTGTGSWHEEFRDSAYVYVGGLPLECSEGDVICIMSQYGEVVDVNLVRDRETGKSRGFGFVGYEDQRSTDLAVDNLTGAKVLGRVLRVEHTREYKRRRGKDQSLDEVVPKTEEEAYNCAPKPMVVEREEEEEERGEKGEEEDVELTEALKGMDPEDPLYEEKRREAQRTIGKRRRKEERAHIRAERERRREQRREETRGERERPREGKRHRSREGKRERHRSWDRTSKRSRDTGGSRYEKQGPDH